MTKVAFSPSPAQLSEILDPARTAVLVIDVQNDFAHVDGVMGGAGVDLSTVDPAVSAAGRLVDSAHAAGAPVIFVGLQTSSQIDSRSAILRRARLGQPNSEEKRVCRKGRWGADWYRLRPADTDINVAKSRYSSFQDTELDLQLKALGIDTLVVCGLTTECCVETAVREAFHRDYHVFVAQDACASYDPQLHAVSIRSMGIHCALILDTRAVVQAWSSREDLRRSKS